MAVNRAEIVDNNFLSVVQEWQRGSKREDLDSAVRDGSTLTARKAIEIWQSMVESRHLDFQARILKGKRQSFYTIGSSGHESNAAVAAASRPTDQAFLHYRSGGFFLQRGKMTPGTTPILDVLLGMVASSDEPIAGGRHKVFGSVPMNIPPQTSTIASHLPKAVGAAFTIARQNRVARERDSDSAPNNDVVVCSFGDASSNHSTACGAFNTAALADHQNLPCPVMFVCEDNGLGISVRTPKRWVETRFSDQQGIAYFAADGLDFIESYDVAREAFAFVRESRKPTFLHLKLVRLLGHAGSDVEQLYRSPAEIENTEAQDPVLAGAKLLHSLGWLHPEDILSIYEDARATVHALAQEAVKRPRIETAAEVTRALAYWDAGMVQSEAGRLAPAEDREAFFGRLPENDRPRHMAMQINRALGDLLVKYPEILIFGEDVARKGGVYHVTADLQKKSGVGRVFNTPLDETAILGLAMGAGLAGMLPMPEIQYLAYLHNAIDQLRGEACSQQFFSNGQIGNPMVVRIASMAYQKGFGGHYHNDNAIAALREIPGIVIACPSNGADAVRMLRTCVAAAKANGRVVVFMEPIALYMTKDLHDEKDGAWTFEYPPPHESLPLGQTKTWTTGSDVTILSYANGLWMSLRVAKRLEQQHGIQCRVVDLRWLHPLPVEEIVNAAKATGKVVVVDECRRSGGIADTIVAEIVDAAPETQVSRVMGIDTFIPLGDAANLVLVQESDIESAVVDMMKRVSP